MSGKTKLSAKSASTRRLSLWIVALCATIFALVPAAVDPTAVIAYASEAFYLPKFRLLVWLSAVLLVLVLGFGFLSRRQLKVPLLSPTLAFLGVAAVSTLFSGDIRHSLVGDRYDGLLTLAAGVLLFYATAQFVDSWAKVRVFLVAGVTSALVMSVYGIVQSFGFDPVLEWGIPWYDEGRAFSTLGNPIFLAAYLTLMMSATVALYFGTEARSEKALWLAALAVIGACWLYTYTRGAMLGVGVSLPVVLFLAYRRTGTVRLLLLPISTLAVAVVAAWALGTSTGADRIAAPETASTPVLVRLYIYRDTLPLILERPLLGHGPDNFAEPFGSYKGEDLRAAVVDQETGQEPVVDKAHNEFLQVAATTGLLGLAAYLWLLVYYFRNAYKSGGWPVIALSGGVLAYILQLQTAFSTIATGVTFWAILGVSVAVMRLQSREKERLNPPPDAEDAG